MTRMLKALVASAMSAVAVTATADDFYTRSSWYVTGFLGRSVKVLGTQDVQSGFGISLAWAKPEPRFKWHGTPAQLVFEGLYEHHESEFAPRKADALALTAFARFRFRVNSTAFYWDIGEGFHFATARTADLPSRINSTPMLGFGIAVRQGDREMLYGIRLQHISNAGTTAHNKGQNLVFVTVGYRF